MDAILVLCRLLHYASALFLFGIGAFQGWLAPQHLARSLDAALGRAVSVAAVIGLLSAVAWLFLASGEMGDGWSDVWSPATWYAVLTDTEFGHVWQIHLLLGAALVSFLVSGWGRHWRLVTVLGAVYLGSLGFIGHAVMLEGAAGRISRASHVVHLLAGGFWLGALVALTACLGKFGDNDLQSDISHALQRFSGLGHLAVAAVVATGFVNVALVLGHWPNDTSSPYQLLLLWKIGLVAVMVGLAVVNRYVLVPKLRDNDASLQALRLFTVVELALGVCVVALVSLFGNLPPK
ncbi:copper homeostasis membrane protein CopD [Pseudaminobacter soli (ex Li et al. 2025)]|uniref:Copper resistance protein CopD n=1 Tax=Pseudaminobacter soli (ex Li et al. 2025) TaxID=1295366 RepID=A0A2P7SGB2_9HYPH|nr:copper homeostasis membrane protein CopD [Mesorhizobium soli]PSJ61532.1 copper resistance protein CopD [Mesorhizobium soli]